MSWSWVEHNKIKTKQKNKYCSSRKMIKKHIHLLQNQILKSQSPEEEFLKTVWCQFVFIKYALGKNSNYWRDSVEVEGHME